MLLRKPKRCFLEEAFLLERHCGIQVLFDATILPKKTFHKLAYEIMKLIIGASLVKCDFPTKRCNIAKNMT